ncbi:MAG: portal protein [Burkholderiaceae bacterium]
MQDLVTRIITKQESLKGFRSPWENLWQDCANYVNPNRGDFSTIRYRGDTSRYDLIYDTTAPLANEQLASGLHSFLTSPSQKWFTLRTFDDDLNKELAVKTWLDKATTILYDQVFNLATSNFNSQAHELYLDLGAFGTGVMMVQDMPGKGIVFRTFHLADCYIQENDAGFVDTLYRKYKRTGRQLLERFGDAVPEKVKQLAEKDPYREFEVIHAVEPSETYGEPYKNPTKKNFKSCYVLVEEKALLEEGGYDEFPYMVPRWQKVAGEIYGRSPSMTSLPDIKMVNTMMKTIIKAAQKVTDPPLLVPDDGFILPVRTVPGGLNFYRSGTQDKIEPLITNARPDIGFEILQNRREHIMSAFHVDWLKMPDQKGGPNMTATEVVARQEEKMRLMGPMVGRLQVEFLGPLIQRVFKIMSRQKKLPELPSILQGQGMKIEYTSPLARAQKSGQLMTVTRLFESMVPLFNVKPDLLDNMNTDETFRYFHHLLDAPPQILNDQEKVEEERQQRAEQQQAMMDAERAQQESQSMKNVAEAQRAKQQGLTIG